MLHPDPTSVFPASVRRIGVIAPASSAAPGVAEAGCAFLERHGFEVVFAPHVAGPVPAEKPYVAASAADRLADLVAFLCDETLDVILCLRGGYGIMPLLDRIPWERLRAKPLPPILGYSDLTALFAVMAAHGCTSGIVSVHLSKLEEHLGNPLIAESLADALAYRPARYVLDSARIHRPGTAEGPVYPVTLSVFCALIGTPYCPDLTGAVLLIEDVGEAPRKVDRMLTQLQYAGILQGLGGLMFGQFTECGPQDAYAPLFEQFAGAVNGPVISGVPFGHVTPRLCLRTGGRVSLSADGACPVLSVLNQNPFLYEGETVCRTL